MDKIALLTINQNISIMPILNLKNVRNDTISSLRLDKILSSFLESDVILLPKISNKKFI